MNKATSQAVVEVMNQYMKELLEAEGNADVRARFYEFRANDGIREMAREALTSFKSGEFEAALDGFKKAIGWLREAQRKYCARAVEKRFNPMILKLPHLDEDIESRIQKKKKEFSDIAEIIARGGGDLNKAGELFWDLRDEIRRAPDEQEQREIHRAQLAAAGKLRGRQKRWALEAEKSRERNKLKRVEEAQKHLQLAEQLERMLG